jgi:CRISPR-associated protein (TIGR03986 family)
MSEQKLPQHANPSTTDRIAYAPYNFVPLPECIVPAEPLQNQDQYYPQYYTGRIECRLTTESPLYVRCGLTAEQFKRSEVEKQPEHVDEQRDWRRLSKNTPDFFYTDSPELPVIPGSSLRGMLRALVEIVSYGKMEKVTDRKLFFRTVDDSSIGEAYRKRMADRVRGGFLKLKGREANLDECRVYTVDRDIIKANIFGDLYQGNGPNAYPNWATVQHHEVWVRIHEFSLTDVTRFGKVLDLQVRQPEGEGWQKGILVISGDMQGKKREFVFVKQTHHRTLQVDEQVVARFHDDDQITRWQARAFPKNRPSPNARKRHGWLPEQYVEPVFFLVDELDDTQVVFFGRAKMFRLPYTRSPRDFVPQTVAKIQIDLAEAMFGRIAQESQSEAPIIAGRISISDAHLTNKQADVWLTGTREQSLTPRILSNPKPTSFQHYLVQDKVNGQPRAQNRKRLAHYDSSPSQTTLRGHKLYWHKANITRADIEEATPVGSNDTQHTQFRPVNRGVTFSFNIRFENLSAIELGALLWVLQLCNDAYTADKDGPYRFKLGMSKPLGMGTVKVTTTTVKRINHEHRYTTLLDDGGWSTGEADLPNAIYNDCLHQFEQYVLEHSGERTHGYSELAGTLRMRCLLAILRCPGPDSEKVSYMRLNQFRYRPVLPTPLSVIGEEPPQPTLPPESDKTIPDSLITTAVETRLPGIVVHVAVPGCVGRILSVENRYYEYAMEDVIGAVPIAKQRVLFRPDKKKVQQGKDKKNVNWAYHVEVIP